MAIAANIIFPEGTQTENFHFTVQLAIPTGDTLDLNTFTLADVTVADTAAETPVSIDDLTLLEGRGEIFQVSVTLPREQHGDLTIQVTGQIDIVKADGTLETQQITPVSRSISYWTYTSLKGRLG